MLLSLSLVFSKSKAIILNKFLLNPIMPFYAVARGRTAGIYMTWPDCEAQVKGFPGARYKKFDSVVSAQDFITQESGPSISAKPKQTNNYRKSTGNASNNLKRNFSTTNNASIPNKAPKPKASKQNKTKNKASDSDDNFSDDSDDLNTMISKQMDDIEKRLSTFEKGIDKIMKKGSKKTILIEPPSKKSRQSNSDFERDSEGFVQVYTDGACSSNGSSRARAGLGVYWGDEHPLNISEPVSGRATNNCGEIQAATRAIKQAIDNGVTKLSINTDSKFLINSVTKWIPGWKRKGWKLASGEPVKNEIDFKDLDSVQHKLQIKWNYVEAHKGIHGNEMADQLARNGASMYGH